jgi:hypothetical protein
MAASPAALHVPIRGLVKLGLALAFAACVSACDEPPVARTYIDFLNDPIVREGVLLRCNQDRDASATDPECADARRAAETVAARQDEAQRKQLELESERKREALRAGLAAEQERQRLAEEAARAAAEAAYDAQWQAPVDAAATPADSAAAPVDALATPADSVTAPADALATPPDSVAAPVDAVATPGSSTAAPADDRADDAVPADAAAGTAPAEQALDFVSVSAARISSAGNEQSELAPVSVPVPASRPVAEAAPPTLPRPFHDQPSPAQ